MPIVTLWGLAADPDAVRNYLEPLEAFGELVLGNGFAALAVLGPRSAFLWRPELRRFPKMTDDRRPSPRRSS